MAITWRNIDAPNLTGVAQIQQSAGNSFQQAINSFKNIFENQIARENKKLTDVSDEADASFQNVLNQLGTSQEVDAAMEDGSLTGILGSLPPAIQKQAAKAIQERRNFLNRQEIEASEREFDREYKEFDMGMRTRSQDLSEEIQRGNLELSRDRHDLDTYIQKGNLRLQQAANNRSQENHDALRNELRTYNELANVLLNSSPAAVEAELGKVLKDYGFSKIPSSEELRQLPPERQQEFIQRTNEIRSRQLSPNQLASLAQQAPALTPLSGAGQALADSIIKYDSVRATGSAEARKNLTNDLALKSKEYGMDTNLFFQEANENPQEAIQNYLDEKGLSGEQAQRVLRSSAEFINRGGYTYQGVRIPITKRLLSLAISQADQQWVRRGDIQSVLESYLGKSRLTAQDLADQESAYKTYLSEARALERYHLAGPAGDPWTALDRSLQGIDNKRTNSLNAVLQANPSTTTNRTGTRSLYDLTQGLRTPNSIYGNTQEDPPNRFRVIQ